MKRPSIFILLSLLLILAVGASQAYAAGPTGKKTPQPKASQPAGDKGNHKGDPGGKGGKNDPGGKPEKTHTPGKPDKPEKSRTPGKPEQKPNHPLNFRGTIDSFDGSTLSLTTKQGHSVELVVDADTAIHMPTQGWDGSQAELKAGVEVSVKALRQENHGLKALTIHVIPGAPSQMHTLGTVVDYSPEPHGSITILDKNGAQHTFQVTADTRILPIGAQIEKGMQVTVISGAADSTARAIVAHPHKK